MSAVTSVLSSKINSKVTAGTFDWRFPNTFVFNDLYIEDQQRDTLLKVDRARVTINVLPLFQQKISFRTIQLTNMRSHIYQLGTSGKYNFQFFLDAFKKDNSSKSKWTAEVETIGFKNCALSFHKDSVNLTPNKFNPAYLDLSRINGHLFISDLSSDSINVKLRKISFRDKSGLVVKSISSGIKGNKHFLQLTKFSADFPHSHLVLKRCMLNFDNLKSKNYSHDYRFDLQIQSSKIVLSDFRAFVPKLSSFNENLYLSGSFLGSVDNLSVKNFYASYGKNLVVDADVEVTGLPDYRNAILSAKINELSSSSADVSRILNAVSSKPIVLPASLNSLGTVSFTGVCNGSLRSSYVKGNIFSDPGLVTIDATLVNPNSDFKQFSVNGHVSADDLALGQVLGTKSQVGSSSFDLDIDVFKLSSHNFTYGLHGKIPYFTYRNYPYQNIEVNGTFNKLKGFDGNLSVGDHNADLNFKGAIYLLSSKPQFHFSADIRRVALSTLNLVPSLNPSSFVSAEVETDFSGRKIDDIVGSLSVSNVFFHKSEGHDLIVNNINLNISPSGKGDKVATINSDYINGTLQGQYLVTSFWSNLQSVLRKYIPAVMPSASSDKKKGNNFTFNFKLDNTESLNPVFSLPVSVADEAVVSGFFNDISNKFRLRLDAPLLKVGSSTSMQDVMLLCENPNQEAKFSLRATYLPKNKRRNPYFLALNAHARNDSVYTQFNFANSSQVTYSGEFSVISVLKDLDKNGLTADFLVQPSDIVLNDTTWNMHSSKVSLSPGRLVVDNFLVDHDRHMLKIDGVSSKSSSDSLGVFLKDFQLSYISSILNANKFSFSGIANSDIYLYDLLSKPYFKANVAIDSAALNGFTLGNLNVASEWDNRDNSILFGGVLASHFTQQKSKIFGSIYLKRDSMDIDGDLHDVDLRFLRTYFGSVLENFSGVATGHVRAFGKFGHIGLQGKPLAKDVSFSIGFLNTTYTLTDTVYMTPTSFRLINAKVKDKYGHVAVTNGLVTHSGFANFKFKVDLNADNFLALNTSEEDNSTFYGKAFADGLVSVYGNTSQVNFKMKVKPREKTSINVPIGNSSGLENSDFITFVESSDRLSAAEKRSKRRSKIQRIQEEKTLRTRITLDMQIEATPLAQINIIMDPRQGDVVHAWGNGLIQMTYDSQSSQFGILGNYELSKGDYLFTFQSIISRKFDILDGSSIHFTGSPYDATLDVNARYALNASLTGILDDPNVNMTTANVNCLLNLTGTIQHPAIKFSIELPNADDETRRKLASIINTDEAVNKNVASLLALGHFYTMDKSNSSSNSELSSVGFSTLSSEVGSMLSRINNDVNVGLNYIPGSDQNATASEFEMSLSTQFLNDRLLLNGNFGYRDNVQENSNVSSGILDFDLEYKLSRSGKYRIKAFNRSNNSYFKQSSSQTQGIGLIFRENFDTFSEWMHSYLDSFSHLFSRRKKTSTAPPDSSNTK